MLKMRDAHKLLSPVVILDLYKKVQQLLVSLRSND